MDWQNSGGNMQTDIKELIALLKEAREPIKFAEDWYASMHNMYPQQTRYLNQAREYALLLDWINKAVERDGQS